MKHLFFGRILFLSYYVLNNLVGGLPSRYCPLWMKQNGIIRDMAFLSDTVSWNDVDKVEGVCGIYNVVFESNGLYDTRMRLYLSENNLFIVFRPTQQNPEGENIHRERRLTECRFISSCIGKVHERFQEAFFSLIENEKWKEYIDNSKTIFTTGHSLGGSLQLFMALYLKNNLNILPHYSIGFAGPFIGDYVFSRHHLTDFRLAMNERWWQIETINKETMEFDGTVETYQIDTDKLAIVNESICGFDIIPLPIPSHAYGMHDLKQYLLYLKGCLCLE